MFRKATPAGALLSPLQLLDVVLRPGASGVTAVSGYLAVALPISLLLYGVITMLLLTFTIRGFRHYADTI